MFCSPGLGKEAGWGSFVVVIISISRRFVFIHAGKTAGTSLFAALLPELGPQDIVFPSDMDGGRNFHGETLNYIQSIRGLGSKKRRMSKILRSSRHPSASDLQSVVGRDAWQNFFTPFAVVRNPWDQARSLYLWGKRNNPPSGSEEAMVESFREWVVENKNLLDGIYRLPYFAGRTQIGEVLKYEDLTNGLQRLEFVDGPQVASRFKRLNLKRSDNHFPPFQELFGGRAGEVAMRFVADRAKWQIERFGYHL